MKKVIVAFLCVMPNLVIAMGGLKPGIASPAQLEASDASCNIRRVRSALNVTALTESRRSEVRLSVDIQGEAVAGEQAERQSLLPHIEINRNKRSDWNSLKYGVCGLITVATVIGGWYVLRGVESDESELRSGCDAAKQVCSGLLDYVKMVNQAIRPEVCSVVGDLCSVVPAATCEAIEGWCTMNNGTFGVQ